MIRLGGSRTLAGFFDVFNMFNNNARAEHHLASGSNFLRPSNIVPPRIARFGAKFDW